jgi:GWxTD domain-containing protein
MRIRRTSPVCILLATAWLSLTAAAGLSPSLESVSLEGEGLSTPARFARIDSLTTFYEAARGAERGALAYRLGQLYLATGLRKHKRLALEYLDEAIRIDPSSFEAARLRATTAEKMRYAREAWRWFEELAARPSSGARGYELLGSFHFMEAKRVLDAHRFQLAREAFVHAVAADSTYARAWFGLAASDLALESYDSLRVTAGRLATFDGYAETGLLLEAAACTELDRERLADDLFRRALQSSSQDVRAVFEDGEGVLTSDTLPEELVHAVDPSLLDDAMRRYEDDWVRGDDIDFEVALRDSSVRRQAVAAYWDEVNPWPSHRVNTRKLRFWKRLVESDVLFGDPASGGRGWDTEMGMALVRWGRPDFMIYEPPSTAVDLDHWYARGVRLSVSDVIPAQTALWVWTYRRPGAWFSLLFTDPTYQAHWRTSSKTAENMRALSRWQPLAFFDTPMPPEFYLSFETAAFPRRQGTMVESYVAIQPTPGWNAVGTGEETGTAGSAAADTAMATVELAIYDGDGKALEYVHRDLRADHLRSVLHGALGVHEITAATDPLLGQIGAQLSPGEYRLGLDVSVPGRGHRAMEMELHLPEPTPPGVLSLSDLELASALVGYRPGMACPASS